MKLNNTCEEIWRELKDGLAVHAFQNSNRYRRFERFLRAFANLVPLPPGALQSPLFHSSLHAFASAGNAPKSQLVAIRRRTEEPLSSSRPASEMLRREQV